MDKVTAVVARVLLAQIFLIATLIQINMITGHPDGYAAYQMYLGQFGLPGIFAPLTLLVQLLGSVALLLGFKTKFAAYVLAAYALFVAFVMKFNEPIIFLQYLAITGGMLAIAVYGPGPCSLDNRKK
jgi:putative oxidoreductase